MASSGRLRRQRGDRTDRLYALEAENLELKRKNNSLVKALKQMTVQHNRLKKEALNAGVDGPVGDRDADEVIARLTREKGKLLRQVKALEERAAKYQRLAKARGVHGGSTSAWEAPAAAGSMRQAQAAYGAASLSHSHSHGGPASDPAAAPSAGFDGLMQAIVRAERTGGDARSVVPLLAQVRTRLAAQEATTMRLKQERERLQQRIRVLETQARAKSSGNNGQHHHGPRQSGEFSHGIGGGGGGIGDEGFRRERELKDARIKVMMLESKLQRISAALTSEQQLHSRTHATLDEFNGQIRDLQRKLQQAQAEAARHRTQLARLQDADEELRGVKDENRVLQERLDKLWNMPLMSQSVKTVDRSDRLAELQQKEATARDDLAYLRKELHKKHEEKEAAASEARRLREENQSLKEEVGRVRAGAEEASRGSSLLQQQLALYGGRADSAGVPPEELLRALGIVRRRLDNPSGTAGGGGGGGDGAAGAGSGEGDTVDQALVLRRRLERVQVSHREAVLELDRSKAMLKRYHDICARQQEDIAELTQEHSDGRATVQRRLREVSQLAESRRRRILHLEALNAKLRARGGGGGGGGGGGPLDVVVSRQGRSSGRGGAGDRASVEEDSLWSDPAGLAPLENLVQVFVVDARLRRSAVAAAGVEPEGVTSVALVDFINFSPMMSPVESGSDPAWNYMVKFPVTPDHTLLRYLATKALTVEVHYVAHADFELAGRATLPLRKLLGSRGSCVFDAAPLLSSSGAQEVGTVRVKLRLAVPVAQLWQAFLRSHPSEAAELGAGGMAAAEAAEAAEAARRAARAVNTLRIGVVACRGLITSDGHAPYAYVYYRLDPRVATLNSSGEYTTRVVDSPPTHNPDFNETAAHQVCPTVDVLDALAEQPLLVTVFDTGDDGGGYGVDDDDDAGAGSRQALGTATVSLAAVADGRPLSGDFDVVDRHGTVVGRISLTASWDEPLVPADTAPDNQLTLPQFHALASRFDVGPSAAVEARSRAAAAGAASADDDGDDDVGAATIAYGPLLAVLQSTHKQHAAVQAVRAACAAADGEALLHGGVGETGSGWQAAVQRAAQGEGRRGGGGDGGAAGRVSCRAAWQALQDHGVRAGYEQVAEVVQALAADPTTAGDGGGRRGARDTEEGALVSAAALVSVLQPANRNAGLAEAKLRRHVKELQSEGVAVDAGFVAFDRHATGFVTRRNLKRFLQSLQVAFTDDVTAVPDPRAQDDWQQAAAERGVTTEQARLAQARARRRQSQGVEPDHDGLGDEEVVVAGGTKGAAPHAGQRRFEQGLSGPAQGAKQGIAGPGAGAGAGVGVDGGTGPYAGAPPRRPDDGHGSGSGSGSTRGRSRHAGGSRGDGRASSYKSVATPKAQYVGWDDIDDYGKEMEREYKGSSAECEAALRDWAGSMEEKGEDAATSLRRAFATMDTDESGTLDATEIAAAIESLGVFVSKESVLAFVDEFGSRGGVTLEQFTSFALSEPTSITAVMRVLRDAFAGRSVTEVVEYFDSDGDGQLSYEEFAAGLAKCNVNLAGKDLRELTRTLDVNANGTVDIGMFQDLVLDVRQYQAPGASYNLSEFERALRRTIRVARKKSGLQLEELFRSFDVDQDGQVTRDEFHGVVDRLAQASPENKLRMGEGDAYRLFQRFDARNTGTIQYADFVRFVDGPSAGDGGGAGDDDAAAYGPPSPMRLRDRRRDVGNKRGGSGSGVSLTAARHKIMNTLCRYSGSYGRLRGAFKRKDPGDRGVMHATMFESVLKQSGVPLMRAEILGLTKHFRKSAREPKLTKWVEFLDWVTPQLLKDGTDEADMAAAVERHLRQELEAHGKRTAGGHVDYGAAFRDFDKSGTGAVSARDFFAKLDELGFQGLDHAAKFFIMQKFDSNGDGYISLREFERFANSGGPEAASGHGHGGVNRDVQRLLKTLRGRLRKFEAQGNSMREVFDALVEGSGSGGQSNSLTYKQFARGLRDIGFKATPAELRALAAEFDADQGGSVEWPEFLALVRSGSGGRRRPSSSTSSGSHTPGSGLESTVRNRERLLRLVRAKMVGDHLDARALFSRVFCEPGAASATAVSFARGVESLGMRLSNTASKRLMAKLARNSPDGKLTEGDFCLWVSKPEYEQFEYGLRGKVLLAAAQGRALNANQVMRDLDSGDTGKLSATQFRAAVRKLGLDLSDQEMKVLASRYAESEGGSYVLYREFIPFVEAVVARYDGVKELLARVRQAVERHVQPTEADRRARRMGTIEGSGGMTPRGNLRRGASFRRQSSTSTQQRVFAKLDPDDTGSVDYASFEKGLKQLGVELPASDMRRLAEALDWDNDQQVGYMEFVQLMQAEAVEATRAQGRGPDAHGSSSGGGGGSESKGGGVGESKSGGAGGEADVDSGVVSFSGTQRGVSASESVSFNLRTCKVLLPFDAARKVKKLAVTYTFLDSKEHRAEAKVTNKSALLNARTTFLTRPGTPGGALLKSMLKTMQTEPAEGEVTFKVWHVTASRSQPDKAPVLLGVGSFNMNEVLEKAADLTHQVVKMFPAAPGEAAASGSSSVRRSGSMRAVAELVLSVNAWSVVETLVDEIC